MLRNADGGGGVRFSGKNVMKTCNSARFNVICVTWGWVWVQFPDKKRYDLRNT